VRSPKLVKARAKFKRAKKCIADPRAAAIIAEGLSLLIEVSEELRVDLEQFKISRKHN